MGSSPSTRRTSNNDYGSYESTYNWLFNPRRWEFHTYGSEEPEPVDPPTEGHGRNEQPDNEEEERPNEVPDKPLKPPAKPLEVKGADLNVSKNVSDHRTSDYDITQPISDEGKTQTPQLIVRRGETFDVTFMFDRKYDSKHDEIIVNLETGKQPKLSKNSLQTLDVTTGIKGPREWGVEVASVSGNAVTVRIQPAPTALIGKWRLGIHTSFQGMPESGRKVVNRYLHKHPVYILFNAWCKNDMVYIEDGDLRDEYVLNPNGKIFTGSYKQLSYRMWDFGQFEHAILDCAIFLLEHSNLKEAQRGDPIQITRVISARINSSDDNGVLVGKWHGNYLDYEGSVSPSSWTGSVEILEQFYKTKKPVRYGQCWVFSGLVTTVSRALGIPTRSVTNFSSAHDTDGSITIDYHSSSSTNSPINELNDDSVWNFHVWNEAWMTRPDLPTGLGGWQAFDATPQETSGGIYCAGPASVKAIKEGQVNNNYDAPFIFAEVNADRAYWIHHDDGSVNTSIEKHSVGKFISTKLPGRRTYEREDITSHYKYAEGTEEERTAVRRANTHSTRPMLYEFKNNDVSFEVDGKDGVLVGNNFDIVLKIKNKSRLERSVSGGISISTMSYTGVTMVEVANENFDKVLGPIKNDEVVCRVSTDRYLDHMKDQASFSIDVLAVVHETQQEYAVKDVYRLRRPDLEVTAPPTVKVGESFNVNVKLVSPMPEHLTACLWRIEGAGIQKAFTIKQKDLDPYETVEITIPITPRKPGDKLILVSFDSKELADVSGSCEVTVNE